MNLANGHLDLRCLDAADATLDTGQRQRAQALLQQIIATPVHVDTDAHAPARPRRHRRRAVVWLPVVAAAVTVGIVLVPGPGGSGMAYASWTSRPSLVAAGDLDAVTHACRTRLDERYLHGDDPLRFDAGTIPVVLAERRGDFVAVLFHQDNPNTSASCIAGNRPGSAHVDHIDTGVGGGDGPAALAPPPGQITQDTITQFGGHNLASFVDGAVGADVAAVTIHAAGRIVKAPVRNGRFAAWWPGKAFAADHASPAGKGGPQLNLRYDATLTDGTTYSPTLPR